MFDYKLLFSKCFKMRSLNWHQILEDLGITISILKRVVVVVQDNLNKELCIAIFLFSKQCLRLARKCGWLFLALYLKQCSSSLQIAYAGVCTRHNLLPVMVSLTRAGYPRIIPSFHRNMIKKGDDRADRLVQLYLSFFTISKIIELAKKVSSSTFKSIVEPTDLEAASEFCGRLRESFPDLIGRYLPWVSTIPLNQGITWLPTWKALPTHRQVNGILKSECSKWTYGRGAAAYVR